MHRECVRGGEGNIRTAWKGVGEALRKCRSSSAAALLLAAGDDMRGVVSGRGRRGSRGREGSVRK